MADEDWDRWTPPASPFRSFDEDEDENSLLPEDNGWIDRWIDDSPSAGTPNSGLSPPASCDAALQSGDAFVVQAEYTIETVTIVTGINKRINLARLCDAKPHIFGVRSQGDTPRMHVLRLHSNFLQLALRRPLRNHRNPPSKMEATSWSPKGMTDAPLPASYTPTAKFKSLPFPLLKQCRPASNKYASTYIPP